MEFESWHFCFSLPTYTQEKATEKKQNFLEEKRRKKSNRFSVRRVKINSFKNNVLTTRLNFVSIILSIEWAKNLIMKQKINTILINKKNLI